MVQIPTFQKTVSPGITPATPIDVGAFSAVSRAQADEAAQVSNIALRVGETFQKIQERERNAERTLKSLEIERGLQRDIADFAETYQGRQDYENFEPDMDNKLQELRAKYSEQLGGDSALQIAFERNYNQSATGLTSVVKAKKLQIMSDRAMGGFDEKFNESLQLYSEEINPKQRKIIKKNIELGTAQLQASGFMTRAQAEAKIQSFEDQAEALRADQLIDLDPYLAEEALSQKGSDAEFADLDAQVRQNKIEKSQVRQKQVEQQAKIDLANKEKKIKQAKKAVHDVEDRAIGDLFLSEEYSKIVPSLMQSKELSGKEVLSWAKAAEAAAKVDETKITEEAQGAEIVTINSMISGGDDPTTIRNYILKSPNLTKENREQYINKLETKLTGELTRGRNISYDLIRDSIIPKRGALSNILETPLETRAVADAQTAFDDYLDAEKAAGRFPNMQDLRRKALELAQGYQVPFAAQIEFTRQEGERLAAEAKAAKGK